MRFAKYVALAGLMIASSAGVTEAAVITVDVLHDGCVLPRESHGH